MDDAEPVPEAWPRIKRAYDDAGSDDGYRVLVDRLWPRGVSRERAHLDRRLPEVAPSAGLRTWWAHDPERFAAFADRYRAELDGNPALAELVGIVRAAPVVTLVTGTRDPEVSHAVVLREVVLESIAASGADESVGGDDACWLGRLCESCGAMPERGASTCWRCGR